MNKKNLYIAFAILALIAGAVLVYLKYYSIKDRTQEQNQPAENGIVLFYGEGCSHCANVDEFISENKIDEKVSFVKKEVYYNTTNASDLQEKAKICGLASIGVPFLWDGSECYLGEIEVSNFFKQKAGIQ